MRTLQSKDEVISLLNSQSLQSILRLDTFSEISAATRNSGEYYEQYSETGEFDDEPTGIVIFNTPQVTDENNSSSYLQVIKLYGENDLPFRVVGVSIWDEHEGISTPTLKDVRSLADALDYAFAAHELDTFEHDEIQQHLNRTASAPGSVTYPELQKHEEQVQAARSAQKALEERLSAPVARRDIARVMSIAKADGLIADEMPSFDLARQMNQAFFAGKGEIHVLYTAIPDEDGSHGELAVVEAADKDGNLEFYDLDGTPKTLNQVMASYIDSADDRLHAESPGTKEDGLSIVDFTEVKSRRMEKSEVTSEAEQELYLKGQQYSRAREIIENAINKFSHQREAKYQSARADRTSLDVRS
ncbi:hypothetical protein [Pseudomonas putida]|uniref:Uncharacterized protein n=1 Tax=Pseudomonas putida TaxID=303 RepID=A0A8I1ECD9_PSEPU|nr:hypothetical protein [Pseudomonas putida]MBI6882709.1 hypothetical protein [Pseudomonas putida]